ncbi:MAG: hypothetical protein JKY78_04375, partial [Hyphomonas sp.]|nr:hypothetical protein [Hyphomonas sp.]
MKPTRLLLLASAALMLAACDFVRFPGDGGPSPATPDAGPSVPPGAPGPPPPSAPVDDPYGNGDQPPIDTDVDAGAPGDLPTDDDGSETPDPALPDETDTDAADTDTPIEDSLDAD